MPAATDEMLRWWSPVMTFRRTATADCELGGQQVRAGQKVVVSFTSANVTTPSSLTPTASTSAASPART
jgi:cytochrome P450